MAYLDPAEHITATIVAAIEAGETGKGWKMPWHKNGWEFPVNAVTNKEYRGINVLMLSIAASVKGYPTAHWATFKQWESLGARVKRGEKSTLGMYYERKTKENAETGEESSYMFAKGFHVFNAAQIDGWTPPVRESSSEIERHAAADALIAATSAEIKYGSDRACYIPAADIINLPAAGQFKTQDAMYSTAFHEIGHWTGAKHRLDRNLSTRFGDDAYAFEELVADLCAAFVCADLGVHSELPQDHVKYVASWAARLKSDKRAIYKAASLAQAARDYIKAFGKAA
jgi:antirestriction protein ArdC